MKSTDDDDDDGDDDNMQEWQHDDLTVACDIREIQLSALLPFREQCYRFCKAGILHSKISPGASFQVSSSIHLRISPEFRDRDRDRDRGRDRDRDRDSDVKTFCWIF